MVPADSMVSFVQHIAWRTLIFEDFEGWSIPWNGTNNLITEAFEGWSIPWNGTNSLIIETFESGW